MRKIIPLVLIVLLISCKAKQKAVASSEDGIVKATKETVSNIINNHNGVKRDFKTAYIKANIDYHDSKQSLGLSADIRMKKDEIILVSVKMLGITMAKAIITPEQVRYYEKIGNKYFEGDYKTLSDWLGTDLNFQKVQNMLIGQAMDDLSKGKYTVDIEESAPKLDDTSQANFQKAYVFEPTTFWLKRQEIKQIEPARKLLVNYSNYKSFSESVFPLELAIFAIQDNETTTIGIEYKNVTINEDLTFPYSVPSGYEQIIIK